MLAVCEAGLSKGWRHYFYGGGNGVAELLVAALQKRYPDLQVAGVNTPPFRPITAYESEQAVEALDRSEADIVWVGLSTPKQERFIAAHAPLTKRAQFVGVGAAFDMNAGLVSRAPEWMQRSGLEWSFRLYKEPRRLWKRYARNNPAFAAAIGRARARLETQGAKKLRACSGILVRKATHPVFQKRFSCGSDSE